MEQHTFSFLDEPPNAAAETPYASGTIFLLDQQYLGTPNNLSSSTPGFVASSSVVASGAWDFASGVTLHPFTNYWFYISTSAGPNSFSGTTIGNLNEPDYYTQPANGNFAVSPGTTLDFRLSGAPIVGSTNTPEPSTFALFAAAVTGLGVARWRKRRQAA